MYVDPIFQARMPDPYYSSLNYGTNGVLPEAAGWNVNSAYLTPTFMAGYRPQYSGPQNMQMPYMGFWRGANTALPTPFQPDSPYYVDSRQYREHALTSSTNKAMDIAMSAAQLGVGIYASSFIGNLASRNLNGTTATMGQMFKGENAMGRLGAGLGRGFGGIGGSLVAGGARIVGAISPWGGAAIAEGGAALGSALLRGGIAVGGAIGGLALPFAIGVGGAEVLDRAAFRPYLAGRQSADVLRSQYAGMAIGGGTAHSPLGLSNAEANRIGFSVSSTFGGRMDFNDMSAPQFMQFGMQEGLYRNLNKVNASTITSRTKELAEQVKIVMDVFNEPSMQDAIKQLGTLMNTGGVTGTRNVASLLGKYKLASAMTGISTRELAGTVGAQGQMMYGQAGLVPALGQASALAAMTGINAAFRSGLVGSDIMAMLGGMQGMTQGAQQGLLGLSQSTYNKIMAYNQYALGGAGGSITSNLNKMGAFIAADPLSAYGKFAMNANKAVSAQLANDPYAAIQGTLQVLDKLPGAKNAQGQYKSEVIYSMLLQQGLDPQSAESLLRSIQGFGAPGYMDRLGEANRGIAISNREKFLEENGALYYNSTLGGMYYGARSKFSGVSQYMGEAWGGAMTNLGGFQDKMSGALFGISGASPATGLYDLNPTDKGFFTEKQIRTRSGVGREVNVGGKRLLQSSSWGSIGQIALGGATIAGGIVLGTAGAALSSTGIGAVIGVPIMAIGAGMMASGAFGSDEAAGQQLKKLYSLADSDQKLMAILKSAGGGGKLSTSDQAYLMSKAGITSDSALADLLTVISEAEVTNNGVTVDKVGTTQYEAAQKQFGELMVDELKGNKTLTDDSYTEGFMPTSVAGTRKVAIGISGKLGMEGSASLGKILYELAQGSYDESGKMVGRGKGTVPTGDVTKKVFASILRNSSWANKLKEMGVDPDSNELFQVASAALARGGPELAAAGVETNDPNFKNRYATALAGFKAAKIPTMGASGSSNFDFTQNAAAFDQVASQVDSAGTSAKAVGLNGQIDFNAMISTIESTAKTNKEAVDKFDLAVEKFRRPLTSEETIVKELAAKGKK